jgi:hypothetical protein
VEAVARAYSDGEAGFAADEDRAQLGEAVVDLSPFRSLPRITCVTAYHEERSALIDLL